MRLLATQVLSYHNELPYSAHLIGAAQAAGARRPESPMGGASRGQPQWGGAGPPMAAYEGECHVTFCLIVTFLKIAESTQLPP